MFVHAHVHFQGCEKHILSGNSLFCSKCAHPQYYILKHYRNFMDVSASRSKFVPTSLFSTKCLLEHNARLPVLAKLSATNKFIHWLVAHTHLGFNCSTDSGSLHSRLGNSCTVLKTEEVFGS